MFTKGYMKINKLLLTFVSSLTICIIFFTSNAIGGIKSKISNKVLDLQKSPQTYSFIVAGHTYGSPGPSMYPAASLLGSIDLFNSLKPDFMMLLGDVIQHQGYPPILGELETEVFKDSLVNKLEFPVFNAPGNHDLRDRKSYKKHFGETYFHFQKSSELYIVLDTDLDPSSMIKPQVDFALNLIELAAEDKKIKNIFVFQHRVIWAFDNYPINTINPWGNDINSVSNNYEKFILPALNLLAKKKNVYLLSGDLGIGSFVPNKYPRESFDIFYQKYNNITYVATGLAENHKDKVIKVDVSSSGEVDFKLIPLFGSKIENIEKYGLDYWKNEFKDLVEPSAASKAKEKVKMFLLMNFSLFVLGSILLILLAFVYILFLRHQLTKK